MSLESDLRTLPQKTQWIACFADLQDVIINEIFDEDQVVVSFKHNSKNITLKFRLNESGVLEFLLGLENDEVSLNLGTELANYDELTPSLLRTWVEKQFSPSTIQTDVRSIQRCLPIIPTVNPAAEIAADLKNLRRAVIQASRCTTVNLQRTLPPVLPILPTSHHANPTSNTSTVAPSAIGARNDDSLQNNWGCPAAFLASSALVVLVGLALKDLVGSDKYSTARISPCREWRTNIQPVSSSPQAPVLTFAQSSLPQLSRERLEEIREKTHRIATTQTQVGDSITIVSCNNGRTGDIFYRTGATNTIVFSISFGQEE